MKIEHRTITNASPDSVFRLYEDVANWHTWDPDTKQATLDGPSGTQILHRVTFSGLLSILLGPMLSRQLNAGLPVTLERLKQRAESRRAA